jgi:DNA-binding LytR/AlgR family response regulator
MKILIVEDELHNYRLLEGMIAEMRPDWEVVKHCESVQCSVSFLSEAPQPDLILMDIQLNDGICFSIFDQVKVESKVIFTTAYDNFAIQAFKVNSVDYLLKPIKESDLEKAIEKFEESHLPQKNNQIDYNQLLQAISQGQKSYRQRFLISGARNYYKLLVKDVAYFYSENRVTFAVDRDGKEHIVDFTLDKLDDELDPKVFFRANRATTIHIDSVESFEDYFGSKLSVKLTPEFKERITISRLKATAFKQWVGEK